MTILKEPAFCIAAALEALIQDPFTLRVNNTFECIQLSRMYRQLDYAATDAPIISAVHNKLEIGYVRKYRYLLLLTLLFCFLAMRQSTRFVDNHLHVRLHQRIHNGNREPYEVDMTDSNRLLQVCLCSCFSTIRINTD